MCLIIQARMGSTRLPGKSMMPLAGRPLVFRLLERVKRCVEVDDIVLAVPDTPQNAALGALAEEAGVRLFLGAEHDVLDRYYQAAKLNKADIVGRLPADNPTPEPNEIDRIVRHHRGLDRPGFSSNLAQVFGNGYPDGIGAEMVDFSLLAEAWRNHHDPQQREHVHLNFFDYKTQQAFNPDWCPVSTIECPREFARPDLVLDVNTRLHYEYMRALYDELYAVNPEFSIRDIAAWHDRRGLARE